MPCNRKCRTELESKRQKQSEKKKWFRRRKPLKRCIEKICEKEMTEKGRKSSYYWPNNSGDISPFSQLECRWHLEILCM